MGEKSGVMATAKNKRNPVPEYFLPLPTAKEKITAFHFLLFFAFAIIPWIEIEKRYAALFKNKKGMWRRPLRLALGACIIQAEYEYPDEEVCLQIQEGPYLQFFCRYSSFVDGRSFGPSLMIYFRKRLTPEILGEINELIIKRAKERKPHADNDNDDQPKFPRNCGTLIVDATCAPSQIKYPQDTELLNEAREITEGIIDTLHDSKSGKKPRTYRKQARKAYLNCVRKRDNRALP